MNLSLPDSRYPTAERRAAFYERLEESLSAVGVHAMTAYAVTQRRQEIGVRMALGAGAWQVCWLFLRGSLVHLAVGLTLGMAGAFGTGHVLRSILAQTSPTEPFTFVLTAAVFIVVSLGACYWPARRATRVDPIRALRYE
jgi:putative ABC transport system permease protein